MCLTLDVSNLACGKLDVDTAAALVGGIAKGCELSGCALIGGETAEMPGMYPAGEYDLAGFAVGVVEKFKILTDADVKPGDVVLGRTSSGVHSNGFSLVRKCIDRAGDAAPTTLDGKPFRQALMEPTRLYVKNVLAALAAHQTKDSWPQTELFAWLQGTAGIDDIEMNRTFNNGIGMVVVIDAANAAACSSALRAAGETVYEIGVIAPMGDGAAVVVAEVFQPGGIEGGQLHHTGFSSNCILHTSLSRLHSNRPPDRLPTAPISR